MCCMSELHDWLIDDWRHVCFIYILQTIHRSTSRACFVLLNVPWITADIAIGWMYHAIQELYCNWTIWKAHKLRLDKSCCVWNCYWTVWIMIGRTVILLLYVNWSNYAPIETVTTTFVATCCLSDKCWSFEYQIWICRHCLQELGYSSVVLWTMNQLSIWLLIC